MARQHVFRWADLPKTADAGGLIKRAGFRQDHGLLLFTWIDPKMKRLAPERAAFDKIILNFDGDTFVEIDGKAHRLTPRSMIHIPADAAHSIWPAGAEQSFFIEVGGLDQPLAALANWQDEFAPFGKPAAAAPRAPQEFTGEYMNDSTGVVHEWDKLKREPKYEGAMMRTAFKSRGSLVTFNYIDPSIKKQPPHKHDDFDQLVMVADGTIRFYLEDQPMELGPRSLVRVPIGAWHAGGPEDGKPVLNIDVFSPPRPDYVYLADYQGQF